MIGNPFKGLQPLKGFSCSEKNIFRLVFGILFLRFVCYLGFEFWNFIW